MRAVKPVHVPYYLFCGKVEVSFTGVIGYDDGGSCDAHGRVMASEFTRKKLRSSMQMGAESAAVSAVYAGFGYRRAFVRQALTSDMTEDLLSGAVPLPHLPAKAVPAGAEAEDFMMKPSFAYQERLTDRMEEMAHHLAELHMETTAAREQQFWRDDDSRSPAEIEPEYFRVEDVAFEVPDARLHDKGVVALPVWAIDYSCLGRQYRGFVSAVLPDGSPDRPPSAACLQHSVPLARAPWEAVTGDGARLWKVIGEMRRLEADANMDWRVQRYWLDEVARVMPDMQKPAESAGAGARGFKSFLPGGGELEDEDYELLGLRRVPPPSSQMIREAFRRKAFLLHPDMQQDKSDEEQAASKARFQEVVKAHERLRLRHPDYLDHDAK